MTTPTQRSEALKAIKEEIIHLTESPLYTYRTTNHYYPVIGEGSHFAKLVFIGEAPGKNEAETGKPFCGAAGRILDELCASIGLSRQDVYVTNIVKDRPPDNRDPMPAEIELYAPFLERQIEIIQPEVVATLGRFSMKFVMERYGLGDQVQSISLMHGRVFKTGVEYGMMHIVPLYHPAVALYNGSQKVVLKKDFEVLKQFI